MTDVLPDELSPHAAQAAHETVGGAIKAAGGLPPDAASDLLHGATDAFTTGLNVTAVVAATVFVALSLLIRARRRTISACQRVPVEPSQPREDVLVG